MAEDPPQQPVERHQEAVLGSGESRKGLDSMMVAPPVPAAQLPDAAQPQANVSGNGASTQGNAMDAAPVDYDG